MTRPLDEPKLFALIEEACAGLGDAVNAKPVMEATLRDLYEGVANGMKCTSPPSLPHAP